MARINGENVTQTTRHNITDEFYIRGEQVLAGTAKYLSAARTTNLALSTTPQEISFDTSSTAKGIELSGTDITFTESGVYQVSVAFSLEKTSVGGTDAGFGWIRINDADVANSGFSASLTNQSPYFNANLITGIGSVTEGSVLNIMASALNNGTTELNTFSIPGGPDVASTLLTIVKIESAE